MPNIEVGAINGPREPPDELFMPWIQLLGSEAEAERRQARAALVKHGQAAVVPLIVTYGSKGDQVREGIINVLAIIAEEAVDTLIQQLVEGDPIRQECASRALARIVPSLPKLMELTQQHPELASKVHVILRELAANLGYSSIDQLLAEYYALVQPAEPTETTPPSYIHRVRQADASREEAKKCYESDLYSQTIETCDRVIQQLLTVILEFFDIDLGQDTPKLGRALTKLYEHGIRVRVKRELHWLRRTRNDIRYNQKYPNKREAEQALRVARYFSQEVKRLLRLRP